MMAGWLLVVLMGVAVDPGVQALGDRLHQSAEAEGRLLDPPDAFMRFARRVLAAFPDRRWSVHVLDEGLTDARALPDGRVYLSLGLFGVLGSEAELAFVIAHEAAHVSLGHGIEGAPDVDHRVDQDEADRVAIATLEHLGYPPGAARGVLETLADQLPPRAARAAGMAGRLAGLPAAAVDGSGPVPGLSELRARLMRRWLERNQVQPALDCLTGSCGEVMPPESRLLLLARAERLSHRPDQALARLVGLPDAPEVLRERALLGDWASDCTAALALWNQSIGAGDGPAAPWSPAAACAGTLVRSRATPQRARKRPPQGWARIPDARHDLAFTRDDPSLQRLQMDWLGDPAQPPALAGDAALRDWRARHPRRIARVLAFRPIAGGVRLDLGFTDPQGLRWRVRIYRLPHADGIVEATFTAPALHLFDRDRQAIELWLLDDS